jgi:hypothetical protein
MPQLLSELSPEACLARQALLEKKKPDFQSFLNERFVDPITNEFSSDRNVDKITEAVDCAITKKEQEEIRIVTDHGKQQLPTVKEVLESICPQLRVGFDREERLIISFSSNAA